MIKQIRPLIRELGPEHAGVRLEADEFEQAGGREGFRYELIKGVLHVSPAPDPFHSSLQVQLRDLVRAHRTGSRSTFVHVLVNARVLVNENPHSLTNPEPDVAAYIEFPLPPPRSYSGINPALVIEVVSMGGHNKDFARNPELYESVPQIKEYWVIDPTSNSQRPSMSVFRKAGDGVAFDRIDIPPGGAYESSRWPGLGIDLSKLWS